MYEYNNYDAMATGGYGQQSPYADAQPQMPQQPIYAVADDDIVTVSSDSEIKMNYSNPFTSGFLFGMGFGIAMLVMLAILIAIFAVAWFVVLKH